MYNSRHTARNYIDNFLGMKCGTGFRSRYIQTDPLPHLSTGRQAAPGGLPSNSLPPLSPRTRCRPDV